jgi:hypothetical protein
MSNIADARPLPPGARVGESEVRMRPITCPNCWKTQRAHDVEQTEYGYRLVCDCGLELLSIDEG